MDPHGPAPHPARRPRTFHRLLDQLRAAIRPGQLARAPALPTVDAHQRPSASDPAATAGEAPAAPEPPHVLPPLGQIDDVHDTSLTAPNSRVHQPEAVPTPDKHHDNDNMDRSVSEEETLFPLHASKPGRSHDSARALFAKYGIRYEPRMAHRVNSDHPRRVEKPIRIRMHWSCHECHTQFGVSRVCISCGHRRCDDCTRAPPKKVKEMLDNARREQSGQSRDQDEGRGAEVVIVDAAAPVIEVAQPGRLEAAGPEAVNDDDELLPSGAYLYLLQQRPISSFQLVSSPDPPPSRRTCHACQTRLQSSTQTQCPNCNHTICSSCPRDPIRTTHPHPEPPEPKMVATVQRVYRKPRQRIRWNCHECDTMFIDKVRCRNCGHERCRTCTRTPSKKIPASFDPAVVQVVNDRLAQMSVRTTTATA